MIIAAIILGAWLFAGMMESTSTTGSFLWVSLFIALGLSLYFGAQYAS